MKCSCIDCQNRYRKDHTFGGPNDGRCPRCGSRNIHPVMSYDDERRSKLIKKLCKEYKLSDNSMRVEVTHVETYKGDNDRIVQFGENLEAPSNIAILKYFYAVCRAEQNNYWKRRGLEKPFDFINAIREDAREEKLELIEEFERLKKEYKSKK